MLCGETINAFMCRSIFQPNPPISFIFLHIDDPFEIIGPGSMDTRKGNLSVVNLGKNKSRISSVGTDDFRRVSSSKRSDRTRAVADPGGATGGHGPPQTMVKFFFTLSDTNH